MEHINLDNFLESLQEELSENPYLDSDILERIFSHLFEGNIVTKAGKNLANDLFILAESKYEGELGDTNEVHN